MWERPVAAGLVGNQSWGGRGWDLESRARVQPGTSGSAEEVLGCAGGQRELWTTEPRFWRSNTNPRALHRQPQLLGLNPQWPARPCPHLSDLICQISSLMCLLLICPASATLAFPFCSSNATLVLTTGPLQVWSQGLEPSTAWLWTWLVASGPTYMSPPLGPFSDHTQLVLPVPLFYFIHTLGVVWN